MINCCKIVVLFEKVCYYGCFDEVVNDFILFCVSCGLDGDFCFEV